MKNFQLIKLTLAALLLTACSGTGLTPADDKHQTGTAVAHQFEERIGIYPARFLTGYVDAIGRRLVTGLKSTPYTFHFKVIDKGEPNAYATPSGHIYLSRGLLALINSEDELAGILAHEISHVTQRHHARQAQRDVLPEILTRPGRAISQVIGEDLGMAINSPLDAIGGPTITSYEHDQESEADRLGMQLAALAGYDPVALATALNNLERTIALLTGEMREASFFDSHPSTPTRLTDIEREAANVSWTPSRPFAHDKEAFLDRLNGLSWGVDNPMQGIFRDQQFMQPDMDFSVTFPDGWAVVNTPIFIGAFAPDDQALVVLGGAEQPGHAEELGAAFIKELHKKAGLEPAEARSVELEAGPAYLVRIEDASGGQPVSITYLWVNTRGTTFQFIAIGADSFRDQLRDTVVSLRHMTSDEKASIVDDRIRSATANAGETLAALTNRTGNLFSPELTAAVNGLPDTIILQQGQLIKILQRKPYLR